MVLTLTMVGSGQNGGGNNGAGMGPGGPGGPGGHAVLSPNDLAQLMSGQTVTGLLNPDGTITLNSNVMSTQQLAPMHPGAQNGLPPMTSPVGPNNYQSRLQVEQLSTPPSNSINNLQQQSMSITDNDAPTNHSNQAITAQKKTGQRRLTAKQKLAQQQQLQQQQQQQQQLQQQPHIQQQKVQQVQSSDPSRQIITSDQAIGQQPQIVATVQLPNGQIGQLIAPSGGQFWSPNSINLQQISMAVAAATGSMSQPMSMTSGSSGHPGQQQINSSNVQQLQQQQQQQQPQHQQHQQQLNQPQQQQHQHIQQNKVQQMQSSDSSRQIVTPDQAVNQSPQIVATVQLPNGQIGQLIAPSGGQFWSPNAINLQQISMAVAAATGTMPQPMSMPSGSGQPGQQQVNGPNVQQNQQQQSMRLSNQMQQGTQQQSLNNSSQQQQVVTTVQLPNNQIGQIVGRPGQNQILSGAPMSTLLSDGAQSAQPQRKLKRLACTCPNCRDGDNSRGNGDKKKQHICHFPECNKVYGKTSHLRAHLRWHSGERPYVCSWSFCGKKFTRSDELQRHRRTHTGEKRFQCSDCLKRFMRSDHLSKHLKTHQSNKKIITSQQQQQTNGMPTISNNTNISRLPSASSDIIMI